MAETPHNDQAAGPEKRQRLFYYTAGFLRQKRVRRILELKGYELVSGLRARPTADDLIAVWGRSPYAKRGEAMAEKTGAQLIRIEDAFLRSLRPGRAGEPPLGLMIDPVGVHFDAEHPSTLERILAEDPLDNAAELKTAREVLERIRESKLTKYAGVPLGAHCPEPGYVLVIDQTRGDASVRHGRADANTFKEMLYYAQEDNPGAKVVIKTHPETREGHRQGYFSKDDATRRITLFEDAANPHELMEGAVAVYTVSSQLGFEAILAGHKPVVFGQPFYAGWGLTDDRSPHPLPRRGRALTKVQLACAALVKAPTWYLPTEDRLCDACEATGHFEALVRAWREDHEGWQAARMRLWKRAPLQKFFGRWKRVKFTDNPRNGRPAMIWASHAGPEDTAVRVEDGFLRSKGLGAELTPPMSLVLDDLGIYYDPTRESRLERLIAERAQLRPDQEARAQALIDTIRKTGVTKYNLSGAVPDLPEGRRILVPGQVEDDASIRLGAGEVCTNLALLEAARAANPQAIIIYKPHPDVEAGLRAGAVPKDDLVGLADVLVENASADALLAEVEEVWTMTSLLGFEALLRGKKVTVTGTPFYAGWGLTADKGRVPARRGRHVSLTSLVHAALIDYPRYHDPISGLPCTAEQALRRLARGETGQAGKANRMLAKLQGIFASYAHLWR